ncbi:MAG: ComEC/Rec2 family competence protein, partial [Lentisphaerae bacterium]|nr:ComEC/Rec2 family competence protein [Lentisphaerota bacterium]
CLSLVLGSCVALLADIFNHANVALVAILVSGLKQLSRIPFGAVDVPRPPVWCVCAWYGALAALVIVIHARADRAGHAAGALFEYEA